jgi:hypothetical protein
MEISAQQFDVMFLFLLLLCVLLWYIPLQLLFTGGSWVGQNM